MTRKLRIMVTASAATALVGAAGIVGASPAMAAGVYECLKPVSTTVYYPNGTKLVTVSAWEPDGVATTPGSCPTGDIAVGA